MIFEFFMNSNSKPSVIKYPLVEKMKTNTIQSKRNIFPVPTNNGNIISKQKSEKVDDVMIISKASVKNEINSNHASLKKEKGAAELEKRISNSEEIDVSKIESEYENVDKSDIIYGQDEKEIIIKERINEYHEEESEYVNTGTLHPTRKEIQKELDIKFDKINPDVDSKNGSIKDFLPVQYNSTKDTAIKKKESFQDFKESLENNLYKDEMDFRSLETPRSQMQESRQESAPKKPNESDQQIDLPKPKNSDYKRTSPLTFLKVVKSIRFWIRFLNSYEDLVKERLSTKKPISKILKILYF